MKIPTPGRFWNLLWLKTIHPSLTESEIDLIVICSGDLSSIAYQVGLFRPKAYFTKPCCIPVRDLVILSVTFRVLFQNESTVPLDTDLFQQPTIKWVNQVEASLRSLPPFLCLSELTGYIMFFRQNLRHTCVVWFVLKRKE